MVVALGHGLVICAKRAAASCDSVEFGAAEATTCSELLFWDSSKAVDDASVVFKTFTLPPEELLETLLLLLRCIDGSWAFVVTVYFRRVAFVMFPSSSRKVVVLETKTTVYFRNDG